jgi:hypothetical protein
MSDLVRDSAPDRATPSAYLAIASDSTPTDMA